MAVKHILVVDDDPMVRESIEMMLELDGHVLEMAGSGAEALDRFVQRKYDVVLTDNRMAGMSGLELAQHIKARHPLQRIILFSGLPPVNGESVCDLVLLKPFSGAELRKSVANMAAAGAPAAA